MSTAEPVDWSDDGVPRSARFGDNYRSHTGALAQARHVFLDGCRLPQAWSGRQQWKVLDIGFGLGLNFLATWLAWQQSAARPRMLHFVSVEAYPVAADDLRRAASAYPELASMADALASQWHGLLPGVHRLAFEQGRVLLTLGIGDAHSLLRGMAQFDADSIYLDGFDPALNPEMWSPPLLKAVARFARRGTRLAAGSMARPLQDALMSLGFKPHEVPGLSLQRDRLEALFDPRWTPRRAPTPDKMALPDASGDAPRHAIVIGAGLSGAAVSAGLARRGWRVSVLEASGHAAAGGSGLPVGLMAPHLSPDDALMSRLTRAGIRTTWQQLETLLQEGRDWSPTGTLERRDAPTRMPAGWQPNGPNESWTARPRRLLAAGLAPTAPGVWHERAGWVKPARLVQAWLEQPGVTLRTHARVARLTRNNEGQWKVFDDQDVPLALADRIVIACGIDTQRFAPKLPLNSVRGQVLIGNCPPQAPGTGRLPPHPINGDGHIIPDVPDADGPFWLAGSTYVRDDASRELREADTLSNLERLGRLHRATNATAQAAQERGDLRAWAGVRCVSRDRRPLVGPADPLDPQGPWVCTALGSRGLTFAALCAELLAARWHGEPLPLTSALAQALETRRVA